MDRIKNEFGILHYVNIKNEKTFVHEKQGNNFAYFRKILIDTKKMVLDLSNTQYAVFAKESTIESLLESEKCTFNFKIQLDLQETVFKFKDGKKFAHFDLENQLDGSGLFIPIEIDRDELIKHYQFAYDYAPKMWLDEKQDDPWFPSTLEFFLENTMPENTSGLLTATTKEPLTDPYQKLQFFNG